MQPAPPAPPAPPGVVRLTLDDAKQMALANNRALALGRTNIDVKGHATAAARKDYFPKVIGSVTYLHFDKDLGQVVTVEPGRRGLLLPGTATFGIPILNQNSTISTVLVAQPVTKLIGVNALTRIARADEAAARAKLDKGTLEVLSGVAQCYHGLLGARRIEAALELQARVLEPLAAANPIPDLRIALLEVRQGQSQVRTQIRDLTDQFNDLLGLPPGTCPELVDPLPAPLPLSCPDDAAALAAANSPEVREAEQDIARAQAGLTAARMDYLPDVNIIGGYANNAATPTIQPNFGFVGVTASYTFLDWGKRGDVRRQRQTQIVLARQNVEVTRAKVQLEARKAFVAYQQAGEDYRLAGEMVAARRDAEKGGKDPAGVMTLKAATAKAELDAMKAEIAYRVAHAQLAEKIGAP
jgi:outer membrane protein TolC